MPARPPSERHERLPPQPEPGASPVPLRWRLAEEDESDRLFPDNSIVERRIGAGEYRGLEFLHVNARTVINRVPPASKVPFRFTINAYRGCSHACTYCFARPTHAYLGLGIGEDFERRIVVKVNAVERVRAELRSPRWRGDRIAMGTNTDPYQKAEGRYHLTRGIVQALGEAGNPFSILTKSTLVLRDLDLLTAAASKAEVRLSFSIGTLDRDVWRLTEPGTPPPDKRVEAVRRVAAAGISCSVLVAPILPGLSDAPEQIEEVVEACTAAGAVSVSPIVLHLRPGVRQHYLGWLSSARPDLAGLYAERFRRGSYQPDAEHERTTAIVRTALERSGAAGQPAGSRPGGSAGAVRGVGTTGHERPGSGGVAARSPAARRVAMPVAEQLRLL